MDGTEPDRTAAALTRVLRARLDGDVPAGTARRVAERVATETARRVHRRRVALSAACVVTVIAGVGGLALRPWSGPDQVRIATPSPSPPSAPSPSGPTPSATASASPAPPASRRVSRVVPGVDPADRLFRARSLNRDGTVAGLDQGFDAQGFDRFGSVVVLDSAAGRIDPRPRPVPELGSVIFADAERVYWLAHTDPATKFELWCRDRATGSDTQVSRGSVFESTVHVDRGHVAWTYYDVTHNESDNSSANGLGIAVASGCGPERRLPVTGAVVALDWPTLYVRDIDVSWGVSRVDALTGAVTPVPRPDADVPGPLSTEDRLVTFAADADTLAWLLGDRLHVLDLRSGEHRLVPAPSASGANGTIPALSVGDRTVALTMSGNDGGPDAVKGVLYDVPTGRVTPVDGDALAAGPWIVRQEGDDYRIDHS